MKKGIEEKIRKAFVLLTISQELKRERESIINKIKNWTKGKKVTKDKLRQFLNELND